MNDSETRYQKYLLRKREKQRSNSGKSTWRQFWSAAKQMAVAANAPIHECLVPKNLFKQGMGVLIFSRRLPHARIAMSAFLLDVFCLGVKDAFFAVGTPDEYRMRLRLMPLSKELERTDPAYFRKLVEGAASYAHQMGLKPHADYTVARQIFGNVEAAACSTRFEYGHEGKPFYISGPHESPRQIQAILDQLQRRLGADNFHFLVGAPLGDVV